MRLLKVSDGGLEVHSGHLFLWRVKADDAGEYECRGDKAATGRVVLRVDSAAAASSSLSEAESSNIVKEDDAAHDEEDFNAIEEQAQLFVFVRNETIELRGDRRNASSIDNRCTAYARSSNGRLVAPDQVAWYDPHGQVFA